MAKIKIRHLVEKPGQHGPRYFWQPTAKLRKAGWLPERLSSDMAQAIQRAEILNAAIDAWRAGQPLPEAAGIAPEAAPKAKAEPGTLKHVIELYRKSGKYPKHPKTRKGYEQNIAVLERDFGPHQVLAITSARIDKYYEAMKQKTPAKAKAVVVMLRMLLQHAVKAQVVQSHPALSVSPDLDAHQFSGRLWPAEAVDLFVETADKLGWHSVGTMVMVNHWIGQRQGDIVHMPRTAWRDGAFYITQRKTGAKVRVEVPAHIRARIEAELKRQADRKLASFNQQSFFLCDSTGLAWKEDHFRHTFTEIRKVAAEKMPAFLQADGDQVKMLALQFLHLRHTAITIMAISGSTPEQIAGVTGHELKSVASILKHYLVPTAELAKEATDKRMAWLERQQTN